MLLFSIVHVTFKSLTIYIYIYICHLEYRDKKINKVILGGSRDRIQWCKRLRKIMEQNLLNWNRRMEKQNEKRNLGR